MAYTAEVSRSNPSAFVFLIDQSRSMEEPFGGGQGKRKADGVADAINRLLQNLVIKCAKGEGINDYYVIGVIGYGAKVVPAFGGPLAGKFLVPISEVANNPTRVEERTKKVDDGAGGLIDQTIKFPVWLEPVMDNGTPMGEAFNMAHQLLQTWIANHPDSYPPIVINITDGEYNNDPDGGSAETRQPRHVRRQHPAVQLPHLRAYHRARCLSRTPTPDCPTTGRANCLPCPVPCRRA